MDYIREALANVIDGSEPTISYGGFTDPPTTETTTETTTTGPQWDLGHRRIRESIIEHRNLRDKEKENAVKYMKASASAGLDAQKRALCARLSKACEKRANEYDEKVLQDKKRLAMLKKGEKNLRGMNLAAQRAAKKAAAEKAAAEKNLRRMKLATQRAAKMAEHLKAINREL